MRRQSIVLVALVSSGAGMWACGGDDTVVVLDAGVDAARLADSSTFDGGLEAGSDSTVGGDAGDADAAPPLARLLLSYNAGQSEMVAFGLDSHAVDGRLVYPDFIGTAWATQTDPWLLEQGNDVVARLDPSQPWVVRSSWSVAMNDLTDAGYASAYSDPQAVVVAAGTKAYVLRYARNLIAIIDPSQNVDGGLPTASIDLSGQLQANGDGYVQMIAGIYVEAKQLVYVLLGNSNRFDVACGGYCELCADTAPAVVAIDVAADVLVDLNGSAPGVALTLGGYNPAVGPAPMAYDVAGDRLLVLHAGCNQPQTDGGVGPLVRREVEEVSLSTGATRTLLDLTSSPFPQGLIYLDAHHAVVQLDTAYTWDPTTATLGSAIPNAPDAFAVDDAGNLLGVSATYGSDGGLAGWDVRSVRISDGQLTKLGDNPFSLTNGFVGGVQLWPEARP